MVSKEKEGPFNDDLKKAVKYLYKQEVITADKDIVDKMSMSKGTVSGYLNGKVSASKGFRTKFEEVFKIKLSDFANDKTPLVDMNSMLPLGEMRLTVKDFMDKIEEHNAFLQYVIKHGLVKMEANLSQGQDQLKDQLKLVEDNIVQRIAGLYVYPPRGAEPAQPGPLEKDSESADGQKKGARRSKGRLD